MFIVESENFGNNVKTYDLAEVSISGIGNVICESCKVEKKLKVEYRNSCSSHFAYGYNLGDIEITFELSGAADYSLFDEYFLNQLQKQDMSITCYLEDTNGVFQPAETIYNCTISDLGKTFEKGLERSIKGNALTYKSFTIDE